MMRRLLSQHSMSECPKRTQPCKYCGKEFVFDTIQVSGPTESFHYFLNKCSHSFLTLRDVAIFSDSFLLLVSLCLPYGSQSISSILTRVSVLSCGSWILVWTAFLLTVFFMWKYTYGMNCAVSVTLSSPYYELKMWKPSPVYPTSFNMNIYLYTRQSSLSLFMWCVMILNDVMMESDNKCTDGKVTLSICKYVYKSRFHSSGSATVWKCHSDCSFIIKLLLKQETKHDIWMCTFELQLLSENS